MKFVRQFDSRSKLLNQIQTLADRNKQYLGFLPLGAFRDFAVNRQLLAAISDQGTLCGYIAFRITKSCVVLVHLCLDVPFRNEKNIRELFEEFEKISKPHRGIKLSCREDFPATKIWPKLGFKQVARRSAKTTGKSLLVWWKDNGNPTLFSPVNEISRAVLDANVFIDMNSEMASGRMVHILAQDFLKEKFDFVVTLELPKEIRRNKDLQQRKDALKQCRYFEQVGGTSVQTKIILLELEQQLGKRDRVQAISDYLQLAHAIVSQSHYFVTRDKWLLTRTDEIRELYGIEVVDPTQIVMIYDEEHQPFVYEPSALSSTEVSLRRIRQDDKKELEKVFINFGAGEKGHEFSSVLNTALSNPKEYESLLFEDENNVLGICICKNVESLIDIVLSRFSATRLARTLSWHAIWLLIQKCIKQQKTRLLFSDVNTTLDFTVALPLFGFTRFNNEWEKKIAIGVVKTNIARNSIIKDKELTYPTTRDNDPSSMSKAVLFELQKKIWPAIIDDDDAIGFILPIKPRWAEALFDERIASESLFSLDPELHLSFMNVYYRDASTRYPEKHSRVFWYVSNGKSKWSKHICAYSLVERVEIGFPRKLHNQFNRFGIYRYEDLKKIQKPGKFMLAFTFSHTMLLPCPIPHVKADEVQFDFTGKHLQLAGPQRLTNQVWCEFYKIGMGENSE